MDVRLPYIFMSNRVVPPAFRHEIRSYKEYQAVVTHHRTELAAQRAYEHALFDGRSQFTVPGYCINCEKVMPLAVDLNWGDGAHPNWRERLQCACGLNNRIRASLYFLSSHVSNPQSVRIYATEQVTAFFTQLRRRYPLAVGSELLRDNTPRGCMNAAGVRHEDVTNLTFHSSSFDVVLSFDVLEHVPDYVSAMREMARILRPGGTLLASFPFDTTTVSTQVRAQVAADGSIRHLFPAEYHGDPVDEAGCLCFQVFGWSVLNDLAAAGFVDARAIFYWSADLGFLGPNQLQFVATKSQ